MGNIYKALMRNQYLAPVGDALRGYMQKLDEEEKRNAWMQNILAVSNKIDRGFSPQPMPNQEKTQMIENTVTDPFLQSGSPMVRQMQLNNIAKEPDKIEKVDYESGKRNAVDQIYKYLINSLGKDIDPTLVNQGLAALQLKASKYDKPKGKKEDTRVIGEGGEIWDKDENGEWKKVAENPKTEKQTEQLTNFSAQGYWDKSDPKNPKFIANPKYRQSVVGGNEDDRKDHSSLLGEMDEGLGKVEQVLTPMKDGSYAIPKSDGTFTLVDYNSARAYAENLKNNYKQSAGTLITQQGLTGAVEIIREGIKKGKTLDEAIKKFKVANPDLDKEEERILKSYFKLFTQ